MKKAWIVVLGVITVCAHWAVVPLGLALHNSDQAIYPLAADHLLRGELSYFPFNQGYGGFFPITFLRALWVGLFKIFSNSDSFHLLAHFSFSYFVAPWFIAVLFYFGSRRMVSESAARWVSAFCAVGFQSWIHLVGIDHYIGLVASFPVWWMLFYGKQNPILEMSSSRLFLAGLWTALNVSNVRASLIPAVAFWVPWTFVFRWVRDFWQNHRRASLALVGVWIFHLHIVWFGSSLGTFLGKTVKLHADSNLKLVLAISFGTIFWIWKHRIPAQVFPRIALVGVSFVLGFIPEVIFYKTHSGAPLNWVDSPALDSLKALLYIPSSLKQNLVGFDDRRIYSGVDQNFAIFLLYLSLGAVWVGARKRIELIPHLAFTFLALIAFCRVQMSGNASAKYLIPIMGPFLLGVGLLWDQMNSKKLGRALVSILFVLCLASTLFERSHLVRDAGTRSKNAEIREIATAFESKGVKVVISDDYWDTLAYSLAVQERVHFISNFHTQNPFEALQLADTETRVGVLFTKEENVRSTRPSIELRYKNYRLTRFQNVGDKVLAIGEVASH